MCIRQSYVQHDLFDIFLTKMFDVTCTAVQRLAYNIRDTIYKNDLPLTQMSKVCIDILLEITEIMDRVNISKNNYNSVNRLVNYINIYL